MHSSMVQITVAMQDRLNKETTIPDEEKASIQEDQKVWDVFCSDK